MRFGVAGNAEFACQLAAGLMDTGQECLFAVSLPPDLRPVGATGIASWASDNGVTYHELSSLDAAEFVDVVNLESAPVDFLVASWPSIISMQTIKMFRYGVVGSHPTQLPYGRGRHPLHWVIAMGLPETSLSLFLMDSGVDTGPLIAQDRILVPAGTTVAQLGIAVDRTARLMGTRLGEAINEFGTLPATPQPSAQSSRWRKRTIDDVTIDFRMSTSAIVRLVQSFTEPFEGARVRTDSGDFTVADAYVIDEPAGTWLLQSIGTVVALADGLVDVRADDGVVRLVARSGIPPGLHAGTNIPPPASIETPRIGHGDDVEFGSLP